MSKMVVYTWAERSIQPVLGPGDERGGGCMTWLPELLDAGESVPDVPDCWV